jgi:hypothetical protein
LTLSRRPLVGGESTIRTIVNKSRKPLRISLAGGKTLFLGPAGTGQVHDDALERPQLKKLIKAGEVEVLGEDGPAGAGDTTSSQIRQSTQGHPPSRVVKRRGDR